MRDAAQWLAAFGVTVLTFWMVWGLIQLDGDLDQPEDSLPHLLCPDQPSTCEP